jgi:hypothetical protein
MTAGNTVSEIVPNPLIAQVPLEPAGCTVALR